MAIKGLAIPVFGKYAYTNSAVTYSEGKIIGHAINYSVSIETRDDNPLYGDDMIVEHDNGGFGSGTLTLNTAELTMENAAWLFGLSTASTSGGGIIYSYEDTCVPIPVGFGIVETHQVNDVNVYRGVILCKCLPKVPADQANTKGETIEWQTPEIEFTVERSDATNHPWKKVQDFTSLSAAETWLKAELGVSAG